jgi:hypothetical protein
MAPENVGKALEALSDEDLRQSVASGNLEGLGDHGLTDDEQSMVVGAAADYPEASGFSFNNLGAPSKISQFAKTPFGVAANYAYGAQVGQGVLGNLQPP